MLMSALLPSIPYLPPTTPRYGIFLDRDQPRQASHEYLKAQNVYARTVYKRKDRKIHPVNVPPPNGENPPDIPSSNLAPITSISQLPPLDSPMPGPRKGKEVPRGSRLTPERLSNMKIGIGFLSEKEKQPFIDILFEYEGAVAFDESEMGLLNPSIEPPIVIPTVPHTPWQQQNLRLPKAVQDAATAHVQEKLREGILEFSQGLYRSRYFLIAKKTPGTWQFINDVQPLNKVTIVV